MPTFKPNLTLHNPKLYPLLIYIFICDRHTHICFFHISFQSPEFTQNCTIQNKNKALLVDGVMNR